MKITYFIIGLAIVSLAVGSFYYTNFQKHSSTFRNDSAETPQISTIYVYREYGDISFRNQAASTYTPVLDTKVLVENKSIIKTGDGRGYVIFPDNSSITLSSSTEIEISYGQTRTSILQKLGLVYYRITPLSNGNSFEIKTPNSLSVIKGTKLAILYDPLLKKTYVAVTEHSVEVTPLKENGKADDAPVIIQEGSTADIETTTKTASSTSTPSTLTTLVVRNTSEVSELTDVINENKTLDKVFAITPPSEQTKLLEKIINSLQKENSTSTVSTEKTKPETETEKMDKILNTSETSTSGGTQTVNPSPSTTDLPQASSNNNQNSSSTPTVSQNQGGAVNPNLKVLPVNAEVFTQEQDEFINSFYSTYEKYFLVRDATTYCNDLGTTSPKEMIAALLTVTNKAGYVLPQQPELYSFANSLVTACSDGSMQEKVQSFVTQFDVRYPY